MNDRHMIPGGGKRYYGWFPLQTRSYGTRVWYHVTAWFFQAGKGNELNKTKKEIKPATYRSFWLLSNNNKILGKYFLW